MVTISNNAVTSRRVDRILDASGNDFLGDLTDPSFALVTTDNTMRVAFSSFPSILAPASSDVYYARVGLENARVVGNTLIPLTTASSTGVSPLPRLRLDGNNYSHIVWAANDNTTGTPSGGIYYAMVNAVLLRRQSRDRRTRSLEAPLAALIVLSAPLPRSGSPLPTPSGSTGLWTSGSLPIRA
jgi:hypothetical protein